MTGARQGSESGSAASLFRPEGDHARSSILSLDAARMRFTNNNKANRLFNRPYRKGWAL